MDKPNFEAVKLARENYDLCRSQFIEAGTRVDLEEQAYALAVLGVRLGDWLPDPHTGVEFRVVRVERLNEAGDKALIHGQAGVNDVEFWVDLKV